MMLSYGKPSLEDHLDFADFTDEIMSLDDDMIEEENPWPPTETGYLSKWTNILHGWQERYFVLKEGVLSYYKNELEFEQGCRGSIRLRHAHIQPHPYDDCRIDVILGDSTWYFRCLSSISRLHWISCIEQHRLAESDDTSEHTPSTSSTVRSFSLVSLNSLNSNNGSKYAGTRGQSCLQEKISEIENSRILIKEQMDKLQRFFDGHCFIGDNEGCEEADSFRLDGSLSTLAAVSRTTSLDDDGTMTVKHSSPIKFFLPSPSPCLNVDETMNTNIEPPGSNDLGSDDDEGPMTPKASYMSDFPSNGISLLSRLRLPFQGNSTTEKNKSVPNNNSSNQMQQQLSKILKQCGAFSVNFKEEEALFQSGCATLLTSLHEIVELSQSREDYWRRRVDREVEKRRVLVEKHMLTTTPLPFNRFPSSPVVLRLGPGKAHQRSHSHGGQVVFDPNSSTTLQPSKKLMNINQRSFEGPDYQGSDSCVSEEHFYDAIDAHIDKMHKDEQCLKALRSLDSTVRSATAILPTHPLFEEVQRVCNERLSIMKGGFPGAGDKTSGEWNVLAKQGDMTIYNREVESADGNYIDPLQAVHTVADVTGREMCEAFWNVQYRLDWEITIDHAPIIIEVCGDDTVLQYQMYKRIWPATQRESLFWSHIRRLDSREFPGVDPSEESVVLDTWMAVNYSTAFGEDRVPKSSTPVIRLEIDVEMFCQTIWRPPHDIAHQILNGDFSEEEWAEIRRTKVTRDAVRCRLLYASQINPGGWAPSTVVRALARREYPHFLERISNFVVGHTANKSLLF